MQSIIIAIAIGAAVGPILGFGGNFLARWALKRIDDYENAALAERGFGDAPAAAVAPARRAVSGWTIEILGAVTTALIVFGAAPATPFAWGLVIATVVLVTALAAADIAEHLLPDTLVLTALWGALLCAAIGRSELSAEQAVISAAAGYLLMASVGLISRVVMRRDGLGQGDVKLVAAIGAFLGLEAIPAVMIIGSLLGVGAAFVPGVRQADGRMAFGPYLLMAGVLWFALPDSIRQSLPISFSL